MNYNPCDVCVSQLILVPFLQQNWLSASISFPQKCLHYQRSAILCFHLHISINTASTFNDPYNYLCSFSFFKFLCFFLNFLLLNSIDKFLLWQQDNKNIIDQNLIKIDTIQAILEVFSIYLLFHSYIINFIK